MRLLGIVALAVVFMPVESRADALVDLLNGKKISFSVRCQNDVGQGGVFTASLNSKGNLIFDDRHPKPVEIVNGRARRVDAQYKVTVAEYSVTLIGNELTVVNRGGLDSMWTSTIQVSGNSCSATYTVDRDSHTYVDKTCRAVSCTVASAPTIASKTQSSPQQAEPGLIEGRRVIFVQGLLAKLDIAVAEYNAEQISIIQKDIGDLIAAQKKKNALSHRILDMRDTLDRLASEQKWPELQRIYPTYKALTKEWAAMKDDN